MGNQLATTGQGYQDLPSYFSHTSDSYVHHSTLGGGKVLKTVQALHKDNDFVVVKFYIKRNTDTPVAKYQQRIEEIHRKFSLDANAQPGVITYINMPEVETDKACYIARQYFAYNLYDRFHGHPFLTEIEKKFFAYQMLQAVAQCHSVGVRHGDIKTENFMVTTWNWLFLTDISFYKPTYLPADNPADYSFFFDSGQRRRCYLAPERFYNSGERKADESPASNVMSGMVSPRERDSTLGLTNMPLQLGSTPAASPSSASESSAAVNLPTPSDRVDKTIDDVTEAMDIFSLGCCIAETFLEGEALFELSQLLSYRDKKYDPSPVLAKISDPDIREMVASMIQLDPAKRLSAFAYLNNATGNVFPKYFKYLYRFLARLLSPNVSDPDRKILAIKQHEDRILRHVLYDDAPPPPSSAAAAQPAAPDTPVAAPAPNSAVDSAVSSKGLADDLDSYIASLHDRIMTPLSVAPISPPTPAPQPSSATGSQENRQADNPSSALAPGQGRGLTMILSVVCSCIQNVRFPLSKLTGLELFLSLGQFVDDEVRLGRLVPYSVALLGGGQNSTIKSDQAGDGSTIVRATALHTLSRLLSMVKTISVADFHIFPEYIFPALSRFSTDPEELVRLAYAQNIAQLAETSRRFLDMACFLKQSAMRSANATNAASMKMNPYQGGYDAELGSLQDTVLKVVIDMLAIDSGGIKVKHALLSDITRLCIFFGRQRVNDQLLPHLITVLNIREWELRAAFFEYVVGISVFVGKMAFLDYMLPIIEEALIDVQEFVTQRALHALTAFCQLGFFDRSNVVELATKTAPLLLHPSAWIRNEEVALLCSMSDSLGTAKSFSFLIPKLAPFLREPIFAVSRSALLLALKTPLTRAEYQYYINSAGLKLDGASDPNAGDILSRDGVLAVAMRPYIESVQRQALTAANALDETELDKNRIFSKHVYSVRVENSAAEAKGSLAQIDRVQQDLFDSLGVQVNAYDQGQPKPGMPRAQTAKVPGSNPEASASRQRFLTTIETDQKDAAAGVLLTRVPRDKVPEYIQRALQLPGPPPDLGPLREGTVSSSAFFKNHQRLLYRGHGVKGNDPRTWRPKGILVATLHEHRAGVTALSVAKDNLFLSSASEDGTVKIWDCSQLTTAATVKSQLTYTQGGRLTSMTICDSSHSVVAGSDDGSVHVFRVDYQPLAEKYDNSVVKRVDPSLEGPVLAVDHFNTLSESLLLYGTKRGVLHGWDLRAQAEAWNLRVDACMGVLSSAVAGPSVYSLLAGTSRGFIVLWDLRFQLPVQIWRHSAKTRIVNLTPLDSKTILPSQCPSFRLSPLLLCLVFSLSQELSPGAPHQGPRVLRERRGHQLRLRLRYLHRRVQNRHPRSQPNHQADATAAASLSSCRCRHLSHAWTRRTAQSGPVALRSEHRQKRVNHLNWPLCGVSSLAPRASFVPPE